MNNNKNLPAKTTLTPEQIHAALAVGAVKPAGFELLTAEDIMNALDSMPDEMLQPLTGGEYFDFNTIKPGEAIGVMVTARSKTEMSGKTVDIVHFETKGGEYVAASTMLVKAVAQLQQFPAYLRIKMIGKTKSANGGEYFNLDIKTMPVPAF